jgi:hypothetical protein
MTPLLLPSRAIVFSWDTANVSVNARNMHANQPIFGGRQLGKIQNSLKYKFRENMLREKFREEFRVFRVFLREYG